jgi:hypothetical protein
MAGDRSMSWLPGGLNNLSRILTVEQSACKLARIAAARVASLGFVSHGSPVSREPMITPGTIGLM